MSTDELRICARRVLIAWDGTVLPKSRDPLMQERMGDLRSSLEAQPQPEPATDLAHELWAMAQSPGPISEVCALMAKRLAQPQPEPVEKWCLVCDCAGHSTDECHSTHGLNTPRDREIARLSAKAQPQPEPVGYCPAYELERLASGHNTYIRPSKFGPGALDGDVPLYLHPAHR